MRLARSKRLRKPVFVVVLGVILYLIAANSGAGWLYVVSAGLGPTVIVSALAPWWNVRGIEVIRHAPVLAMACEPFECTLEVKSKGRLARHLLEIKDHFAGDTGRAVVTRVRRDKPVLLKYTVENPRRDIYAGGDVTVETGAPFGLFFKRSRTRVNSEIVVYPRTFKVAELLPSATTDAERGDRAESATLHRGYGGEFWGVREYRSGDSAQLVAWKRSARSMPAGKLAVVELAQETHPPLVVALNLDPRALLEAREMVVSAGASLLLYGLKEGREVRASAGPQRTPFPEELTPDGLLTWCAALQASRPPDPEGTSVEIRLSTKRVVNAARNPDLLERPGASEAQAIVLVSCYEFAGPGEWMSPDEEREFLSRTEANGRRIVGLGAVVEEPWRIG